MSVPPTMPPVPLDECLVYFGQGESFFLRHLDALDDDDFAAPSLLPGWTRAHVVSHLSRNAVGLGNLLTWALTGVETPMYPSAESRATEISVGARQSPAQLRAEAHRRSEQIQALVPQLPPEAWNATVTTLRDPLVSARAVPWLRVRETWVHTIDLATSARFEQMPPGVIAAMIREVIAGFASAADAAPLLVSVTGADGPWRVGGPGEPIAVTGGAADVLAWLLGRSPGDGLRSDGPGGLVPQPPRWM